MTTRVEHTQQVVEKRTGPIPPPEDLQQYDEIIPNGADRIMAMAEAESKHRHTIEEQIVNAQVEDAAEDRRERRRGQWFALLISFGAIGTSGYLIANDKTVGGSVLGGTTIASLATAFIYGRRLPQLAAEKKPK